MKNFIIVFLIILSFSFTINLHAQGETAVPFLLFDVSPNLNGMAGAFTALPTDDVYGAYFNPAQIGYFSRNNNFALGFYPAKTDWLSRFNFSDLTFHSNAFVFGYKFKSSIPVNIGFGYMYTKFDLRENVWTDTNGNELGAFNSYENSSAFTLGVGIDYFLRFNFGLTYKDINSNLMPVWIQVGAETRGGNGDGSAMDYGILFTAPVIDLFISKEIENNILNILPFLDLSLGYSIHNIGDEIKYYSNNQDNPLPRYAKLGYGISLGVDQNYLGTHINLIKLDFSTEARDMLVNRTIDKIKYQTMLGDISFIENVISGKTSENVSIHRGWRIKMFDTFQYSSGNIKGEGYLVFNNSSGISIGTRGLLIWLSTQEISSTLKYIAEHFSLEYAWSKLDSDNEVLDGTEYKGIQLKVFGY